MNRQAYWNMRLRIYAMEFLYYSSFALLWRHLSKRFDARYLKTLHLFGRDFYASAPLESDVEYLQLYVLYERPIVRISTSGRIFASCISFFCTHYCTHHFIYPCSLSFGSSLLPISLVFTGEL